jgi:hypothetical protein
LKVMPTRAKPLVLLFTQRARVACAGVVAPHSFLDGWRPN